MALVIVVRVAHSPTGETSFLEVLLFFFQSFFLPDFSVSHPGTGAGGGA